LTGSPPYAGQKPARRRCGVGEAGPERIWLQWDLDEDPVNERTWCADKINDSDTEYVRAAEIERLRKLMAECPECRLQAKIDRLGEAHRELDRLGIMPNGGEEPDDE
jgi:hypothetical protein